ncbi:MAG TPA: hypothetical protein PLA98_12495, partial [Alicycliphilus sp.]|nr:hypothetical protein [Alicycliphilus sp.]
GQIMVLGFLGTLISLERAQAIGRPWAYLAPALLAAGRAVPADAALPRYIRDKVAQTTAEREAARRASAAQAS